MPTTPENSGDAGSKQQVSLPFTTNVPPPGRLELTVESYPITGKMEASLGCIRNRHKAKRKGK